MKPVSFFQVKYDATKNLYHNVFNKIAFLNEREQEKTRWWVVLTFMVSALFTSTNNYQTNIKI